MTISKTFRGALLGPLFAAIGMLAACGGGGGGDGDDDTGDDPVEPIPENMLLDDLEDGEGAIHEVEGRIGAWFSYNDETNDSQMPSPNGEFVPTEGGPEGSAFYAGTRGAAFSEWGAGFGFDLNNTGEAAEGMESQKQPYDASKYAGIRFMARSEGDVPVRVSILVSAVVEAKYGGGCTPPAEPTELEDCGDGHGKTLSLTGEWKEYRVPFEGLKQGDWGLPADFDAATITSIHFDIGKDLTFDVGIDSVGFYE